MIDTLQALAPGARCDRITPADTGSGWPEPDALASYDAVFLGGSPLHLYEDTPEVRRELDFMRAVFASGAPSFGSCAGLQIAVVASGGTVRPNPHGQVAGFGRRIAPTAAGLKHPLLAGRPAAFDAPSFHSDEVETMPEGAVLLATSAGSAVQAVEIRFDKGLFWGVQYHPELSLAEVAAALRRQTDEIQNEGIAAETVESQASLIDALDRDPRSRDLAWQLGLDEQVTDQGRRVTEIRNFLDVAVRPNLSERGRA